jgi:hypothetical protein
MRDEKESSHDKEFSPSSVPNDKHHMKMYLKDLCEYGEYQRFVDAVFAFCVPYLTVPGYPGYLS